MRNTDTSVSAHSRAIRRVLSCSAVAATLLGAMTLTAATQAHADSGRRVCVYAIDTVDPKAPNENVIWGVNYKKDGACPTVTNGKNGIYVNQTQPVPKITCEAFQGKVNLGPYNSHSCSNMLEDHAYRYSQPVNSANDAPWKQEDRGPISDFG